MRKPIYTLLTVVCLAVAYTSQAQCPKILNCPAGSLLFCDLTDNDSAFWNVPPFTWSNTLENADLHEGSANLALHALDTCGNATVSYTIFLDLNNDALAETVVFSGAFPPPGQILANNAFNPGYTGGDTLVFDARPLADSLRYQFALESYTSGDTLHAYVRWTTAALPFYVTPRLPEGRHRIIWKIQQGNTIRTCDYTFRVKDCSPPTLFCQPALTRNFDSLGHTSVRLPDVLISVEDVITPDSQLALSIRRTGQGTGFPVDSLGNLVTEVQFACSDAGQQTVELWARDRAGNTSKCTTDIQVVNDPTICTSTLPRFCARSYWNDTTLLTGVDFRMVWLTAQNELDTALLPTVPGGCAPLAFFPPVSPFTVSAANDSNIINGVSTLDMVLISKHILNIEELNAPWKLLAADVNKSNSITTFDIVELRKVVLGIYTKFPKNTSWRYYIEDCNLPVDPLGMQACATHYNLPIQPFTQYPARMNFRGLKVGDVNGNAVLNNFGNTATDRGPESILTLPDITLKAGQSIAIPLRATDANRWSGLQAGFQFDPDNMTVQAVTSEKLTGFDENAWAQPQSGRLNISWFDAGLCTVLPGDNLFTLQIRARKDVLLREAIYLTNNTLQPEAYPENGSTTRLALQFRTQGEDARETLIFPAQPNPTTGSACIPVRLQESVPVIVEIFDATGKVVFQQKNTLQAGAQLLEIPAAAIAIAGVYGWRVQAGGVVQTGKLVRL